MISASVDGLVGRARELELFRALRDAVTSGAPATLLIEGGAGIGKTRLLTSQIDAVRAIGNMENTNGPNAMWTVTYFENGSGVEAVFDVALDVGDKDPPRSTR
jgi:hypothetical protein